MYCFIWVSSAVPDARLPVSSLPDLVFLTCRLRAIWETINIDLLTPNPAWVAGALFCVPLPRLGSYQAL